MYVVNIMIYMRCDHYDCELIIVNIIYLVNIMIYMSSDHHDGELIIVNIIYLVNIMIYLSKIHIMILIMDRELWFKIALI